LDSLTDNQILGLITASKTREKGFQFLIDKYKVKVYWHIRRMVIDHDDADDVVQEVFIKIWKNIHKFRGDSDLYTWIYRIASNEALGFLRKKKRSLILSGKTNQDLLTQKLHNDAFFCGDQFASRFQEALLSLPHRQRMVFNMKYFEEMKYEEISKITGLSPGGLKASYHHAVKKIKKELTEIKPFGKKVIKHPNETPGSHTE